MRKKLVLDAIRLAMLVHFNGQEINKKVKSESNKYKLKSPVSFYSTREDAQCMVSKYEDGCCMVFRGTTNTKDWMTNLNAILTPLMLTEKLYKGEPRVHAGFLKQYSSLQLSLISHANAYMRDNSVKESSKTFYYFGHSLGGALATLSAAMLGALYPNARHVCITFGSPRVGDSEFVKFFRENVDESVRCVNQEDPVPFVPTACRFEHVYGISYIDKNEEIQKEITEMRLCQSCMDCCLCCFGMAENPLRDHDLKQYESAWNKT